MSARIKDWKDLKLTMMENWSSRLPMRRHAEKFRRRFGLRRLCYGFMLLVTVAIFTLWSSQAFEGEKNPPFLPSFLPYLQNLPSILENIISLVEFHSLHH